MSVPPEQFLRIAGRVNLPVLSDKRVVIVGVGAVGSPMARQLASCGVGRERLIDGKTLKAHNLARHELPAEYVGMNKAAGMTLHLDANFSQLAVEGLPRDVDVSLSDASLDGLLVDADLVVAATDDRTTQRRIGRRALALDIPAIFPALYAEGGGEVFVQLHPGLPCFMCWDGFRPATEQLRAVTALNAEGLAVVQLAVEVSLGLLDRDSTFTQRLMSTRLGRAPQQLFIQHHLLEGWSRPPMQQRPGCPSCSVGPSPLNQAASVMTVGGRQPIHAAPVASALPASQRDTTPTPAPLLGVLVVLLLAIGLVVSCMSFVSSKKHDPRVDSALATVNGDLNNLESDITTMEGDYKDVSAELAQAEAQLARARIVGTHTDGALCSSPLDTSPLDNDSNMTIDAIQGMRESDYVALQNDYGTYESLKQPPLPDVSTALRKAAYLINAVLPKVQAIQSTAIQVRNQFWALPGAANC